MAEGPAPRLDAGSINRSRVSMIASLAIISIMLSAAVALMIPGLREWLPPIDGLNYGVVQVGLVLVVLVFTLYSYERERHFRKLTEALIRERVEASRLAGRLEFLREVQTERDTVAALLLSSADGVLVVDRGRKVEQLNPSLEKLLGKRASDVKGVTCEELFDCKRNGTLACGECPFRQVFETGSSLEEHAIESKGPDGSTLWISGAFAPVRGPDGEILFGIGTLRDSTRRKEVEQLQHDFVSIVSHELRGPLTAIKGFVRTLLLKSDRLPPDAQMQFLATIDEQADRLNQLVEDLLNVSRIDTRRLKLSIEEVDVPGRIEKLVGQFRGKWGDREIILEADPSLPLIRGDASKLDEVFINLIDNAVKYSPNGGSVKVAMHLAEDHVEVSVEDSGIGIGPEDAARLFEKFHRIATPETRDIGGTGLGLYIVKNLVEAHGGVIFVTSARGVGSTFTFTLPIGGPADAIAP